MGSNCFIEVFLISQSNQTFTDAHTLDCELYHNHSNFQPKKSLDNAAEVTPKYRGDNCIFSVYPINHIFLLLKVIKEQRDM